MLQIIINEQSYQLGQPLPAEIYHTEITYISNPYHFIQITKDQEPLIRQWLADLISRCTCEHISYNGALNCVADLRNHK